MSKQKIPIHLRKAIWIAYNCKSGYEKTPMGFLEMEIDHIIPERVWNNPREPKEFNKWRKKYHLDKNFNIHGIENLCPSTEHFNLMKSDKGLNDKGDAYRGYIARALVKAQDLKPKITELSNKFKKELDKRSTAKIIDVIKLIGDKMIDLKSLASEGLRVNLEDVKDIEKLENYNVILNKYRTEGIRFYNFGEYYELKSAIRYSQSKKIEDIDFWISLIDSFIERTIDDSKLYKNLFYEKLMGMFYAKKSLIPIEIELIEYFTSMKKENNMETLSQASTLFNYFYGEFQQCKVKSKSDTIFSIRENLLKTLEENIKNSKTKMRIAFLEYTKFLINASLTKEEFLAEDSNVALILWIKRYYRELKLFLDILEGTKFFDFNAFYNYFIKFSEKLSIIREPKEFNDLFERIVNLKNIYEGNNSTIPDLMKIGIELINKKRYPKAIKHFQKIKNKSFTPDTLYDCIFSIYFLGESYNKLGLSYASKYYFMVAYYLSIEMDAEYNIKQLTYNCGTDRLAMLSYNLNDTLEAIYFSSISLILREFYSIEGFNFSKEKDPNAYILLENIIRSFAYTKQKSDKLYKITSKFLDAYDLLDIAEEVIKRNNFSYSPDYVKKLEKLNKIPFMDTEDERLVNWHQLGINWSVRWSNKYIDTSLAEEFIAYLQIILSTLEEIDILSTSDLNFKVLPSNRFHFYDMDEEIFIEIPIKTDSDLIPRFINMIVNIMKSHMIISIDQILQEIAPIFETGYFSNIYRVLYKALIQEELFNFYNQIYSDGNE
ncbi:hypothetical protein ES705_06113 [subsurface metagenome]